MILCSLRSSAPPHNTSPASVSALEVFLVKDNPTGQVDGEGTEDGRTGDVGSDGVCQLNDGAHEERGDNLREEEGAV